MIKCTHPIFGSFSSLIFSNAPYIFCFCLVKFLTSILFSSPFLSSPEYFYSLSLFPFHFFATCFVQGLIMHHLHSFSCLLIGLVVLVSLCPKPAIVVHLLTSACCSKPSVASCGLTYEVQISLGWWLSSSFLPLTIQPSLLLTFPHRCSFCSPYYLSFKIAPLRKPSSDASSRKPPMVFPGACFPALGANGHYRSIRPPATHCRCLFKDLVTWLG